MIAMAITESFFAPFMTVTPQRNQAADVAD
jgi:hypothetical protein